MLKSKRPTRFSAFPFGILFFAILAFIFFWKFFLKGLIPFPADITVGLYYPWLDYKWGFPTGVPVKNPLPSDIPSLLYPWRVFVIEQLKKGIWPLWNPYYFAGMPLLANFQSATFSLANVFFLFFNQVKAWSLGVIIQPFLTGFFTFLFLRHLGLKKISSVLGGVVFAFCGFNIMWLEYNVHGHTGMWLPILLLVVDKILTKKNWPWIFLGSFILAFQVFAGYPQIVLYSLTVAGFYALFRLFLLWKAKKKWSSLITPGLLLWTFVILGLSLAAVQILPGMEALRLSVRKIDPLAEHSSGGFLPWQDLITFLAPDFFGNPATYNFWGKPWYDNFALYVGIFPLILAAFAIFLRRDGLSWFFASLSFFALLLALPTPIGRWINDLGIYGVRAIPAKSIFFLSFSLATLTALGLDWWLAHFDDMYHRSKRIKRGIVLTLAVFFVFFLGLWGFVFGAGRFFADADWLVHLGVAKRNLILPTALFFASGLVLIMPLLLSLRESSASRRTTRRSVLLKLFTNYSLLITSSAIILLTTFDLFRFGWKYLSFSKPELVFPTTPVIEFLQLQERPFRVEFGEAIPQNMWMPYGLESAAGYDAMAPLRYSQFLGAVRTGRADTPYGRVAQVENYDSPLFNLLNIKYLLAVKYDERGIRGPDGKPRPIFDHPEFKLVFEDGAVQVYENLAALPRAFWIHDYEVIEDDQEIIASLSEENFDLTKKIVLEKGPIFNRSKKVVREEYLSWLKYQPNQLILEVFSDQPGFVFLGNSFYPGWRAFVDSRPTEIYRANFSFGAVPVNEGRHLVEFKYEPKTFLYGGLVSGLALGNLLMISGVWVVSRFFKKHRSHV